MTDPVLLLKAAFLGLIEGLTEFLPISSTGHLIIARWLVGFDHPIAATFTIVIQLGAILAVCLLYSPRLLGLAGRLPTDPAARRFALGIALAFLPAVVLGVLFHDVIKERLFQPAVVALMLLLGGFAILLIERRQRTARLHDPAALPLATAFQIGLCQCLALVPGVSRSGASILGAVMLGVDRRAAAEFSFFLAIPTMLGATVYDLWKSRDTLTTDGLGLIAVGFVTAFLAALLVVRALLRYLATHDFRLFGWYRIAFGLFMLAVLAISPGAIPALG